MNVDLGAQLVSLWKPACPAFEPFFLIYLGSMGLIHQTFLKKKIFFKLTLHEDPDIHQSESEILKTKHI